MGAAGVAGRGGDMERRDLWRLPDDLTAMGWQWVPTESAHMRPAGRDWYKAVYARPFDRGIDDDRLANHDRGEVWVRVSTNRSQSTSWDEAHRDAIALMRDADAKRRGG
jgi:hypothetical protein